MPISGSAVLVGSGPFVYELHEGFGGDLFRRVDCAGVTIDSKGRIYVLTRSPAQGVVVLTPNGKAIGQWGSGVFRRGHAICAAPDDSVFCVDDQGHAIRKFTNEGRLIFEIDRSAAPSETGYVPEDITSVKRSGPPFNTPTGVAVDVNGDLLVSDGYGNARVHRFSSNGDLISSFGEPGPGPGEFLLPHGISVDSARLIYVADRENSRVQVFSPEGSFLAEWRSPRASCFAIEASGTIFVAEMGEVIQGPPGRKRLIRENAHPGIAIKNPAGELLAHLPPRDPEGDGLFFAPHSIAIDSAGNLYVAEVPDSYSGGLAPPNRPRVHKYVRQ